MGSQKGMSLVEILVGLVIGLLAMLAIFQTLALFESQRRTTGAGADMQQNGLSALYALEQDIRLGGFGLIDNGLVVNGTQSQGSIPCQKIDDFVTPSVFQSIPIRIQDGGTGLSDTLITARLDSDVGGMATGTARAYLNAAAASNSNAITVDTGKGLKAKDYILVSQAGLDCALFRVDSAYAYAGTDPTTITVAPAAIAAGNTSLNPAAQNYSAGAEIIDIGQNNPIMTSTYSVSSGNLVETDNNSSTSIPQGANIVNIQAQYGVAPAGSQSISCWTNAAGSACNPASGDWANPSPADFQRIKAIRIAVVAKSALKEKPRSGSTCDATTSAPATWPASGLPAGSSSPPTIDLSSDANWKCYRYRVYWTVVPLRNVIWGNL